MADVLENKGKKLRLRIVTPTKTVFDKDVDMVIMNAIDKDGYNAQLGVLAGHEPLTTILGLGPMRVFDEDAIEIFAVFGGFCEINQKGVTVLAEIAEHPDDIDAERARQALERAERRKQEKTADFDEKRAKLAIRRASVRLELFDLASNQKTPKQ